MQIFRVNFYKPLRFSYFWSDDFIMAIARFLFCTLAFSFSWRKGWQGLQKILWWAFANNLTGAFFLSSKGTYQGVTDNTSKGLVFAKLTIRWAVAFTLSIKSRFNADSSLTAFINYATSRAR